MSLDPGPGNSLSLGKPDVFDGGRIRLGAAAVEPPTPHAPPVHPSTKSDAPTREDGKAGSPTTSDGIVTFYRMIDQVRLPQRADRTAGGTLPIRAVRHCDAVTSASAFGWWIYAPLDFSLMWDGELIYWTLEEGSDWMPLSAAQYPNFARRFDAVAPAWAKGGSPPLLSRLPEAGCVQIWSGLLARTAPDWSLLVRAPVNLPGTGYAVYEGIIETDCSLTPLFMNLRLARTNVPIRFQIGTPIGQLQPLPRVAYADDTLKANQVTELERFSSKDWDDYVRAVITPSDDPSRRLGAYAAAARRRRRCPATPDAEHQ